MLPPLTFVLGKGGVGRSTIAAALGLACAARGERTLVAQWAVSDVISPWFARPPAAWDAGELAPLLATMNFSVEAALRQYFVEHLHLPRFYRHVVDNRHVRRFTRAAPGFEELMFLGTLMWWTTLARAELGWSYDRVIVDTPAIGHSLSLLAMPRITTTLGLGGLLGEETARVAAMLADARRCGVIVVSTAEELAVDETLELWPRVTSELGRAPLALVLNRRVGALLGALPAQPRDCAWLAPLAAAASPAAAAGLARVYVELARRAAREQTLTAALAGAASLYAVDEALLGPPCATADLLVAAAAALAPLADGGAGA